jgi:hypothetical protein
VAAPGPAEALQTKGSFVQRLPINSGREREAYNAPLDFMVVSLSDVIIIATLSRFDGSFSRMSHSTPENTVAAILRSAPGILEPAKEPSTRFMFTRTLHFVWNTKRKVGGN